MDLKVLLGMCAERTVMAPLGGGGPWTRLWEGKEETPLVRCELYRCNKHVKANKIVIFLFLRSVHIRIWTTWGFFIRNYSCWIFIVNWSSSWREVLFKAYLREVVYEIFNAIQNSTRMRKSLPKWLSFVKPWFACLAPLTFPVEGCLCCSWLFKSGADCCS